LEPLGEQHNRAGFSCGKEPLDRYLQTQVTQDIRRRIATCFVAIERTTDRLAAYFTLASAGIPLPIFQRTLSGSSPAIQAFQPSG
jgi:hypothetical protein